MYFGSPHDRQSTEQPESDATTQDDTENDGGNSESSILGRVLSAAQTASDLIAPFGALLTSIVQLITIAQVTRKI